MGISGIHGYQQWDIRRDIQQQKPIEAQNQDITQASKQPLPTEQKAQALNISTPVLDQRRRMADLEDISLTFKKAESFDHLGNESGLENLDMQKAISDMKKDEVLQGYQYFVGSAKDLVMQNNDDGAVFRKLGL